MIHRDTLWTYSHPTIFLMKAGDVLLTALGPQPAENIDPPAGNSPRVGVWRCFEDFREQTFVHSSWLR